MNSVALAIVASSCFLASVICQHEAGQFLLGALGGVISAVLLFREFK